MNISWALKCGCTATIAVDDFQFLLTERARTVLTRGYNPPSGYQSDNVKNTQYVKITKGDFLCTEHFSTKKTAEMNRLEIIKEDIDNSGLKNPFTPSEITELITHLAKKVK